MSAAVGGLELHHRNHVRVDRRASRSLDDDEVEDDEVEEVVEEVVEVADAVGSW